MQLTFDAVLEPEPGARWQALFARAWPGWRAWYLARGGDPSPRLDVAERALRRHMPELERPWRHLVALAGGGELAANFLTFWCPPPYLIHCAQAVLLHEDGPLLVRNYDLDPRLSEATLLCSAWTGRRVIATMEGIAGAADGINDAGLAVSLTFGGRRVTGPGFGIPLIIRYLLEVCDRTADAVAVLRRVPSHMSYNVTIVDRASEVVTVFVAPDRPAIVTRRHVTTNHQQRVEWPEQARFSRTVEREAHLLRLLEDRRLTPRQLVRAFLARPLFSTNYAGGFGTVYTAAYRPAEAAMAMHWPGQPPWEQRCGDFREGQRLVHYRNGGIGRPAARAPSGLPEPFIAALADGLRRPASAAWERLGQVWSASHHEWRRD